MEAEDFDHLFVMVYALDIYDEAYSRTLNRLGPLLHARSKG